MTLAPTAARCCHEQILMIGASPQHQPDQPPPAAGGRRLRLSAGALIATAALGPLLLGSAIYSQHAVQAAARVVLVGEAQSWSRLVWARLRDVRESGAAAALQSLLAESAAEGLTYAGYVGRFHRIEVGESIRPVIDGDLQESTVTWVGHRVRYATPARPFSHAFPPGFPMGGQPGRPNPDAGGPPEPPEGSGPFFHTGPPGLGPFGMGLPPFPPPGWKPNDGPGHHGPRPMSFYVVEFEPRAYADLVKNSQRTLTLGALTAATVMLLSAWVWQSMRRRSLLEREAQRAAHLAELGAMSAVLAHEIRNPLASLKGHAQLLVEGLEPPAAAAASSGPLPAANPKLDRARSKAVRIVDEAIRIERITSDLLDFVREGALAAVPTDLGQLVRLSVEDVIAPERLRLRLPEQSLILPLEPERLRQAIDNVARNASQAGDGPIEITVAASGSFATLTVRDHGPGISAGQEERIFEPFMTTRTRGTGLGLSIARRIVARHGGTLVAGNHPEGGAVFTLTLPLDRPAPAYSRDNSAA
jgi:two-component system sensor histidine kinase HydH